MTDQIPAPGPSGYQPSPEEGITEIAFEVTPSWGYQKVALRGTYTFPEPRAFSEALPAIDELYAALEEDAARRVDSLVALKDEREAARKPASAPAGPAPAPQPAPSQAAPGQAPHPVQQADQLVTQQLGGQQVGGTTPSGLQWQVGQKPQQRGSFKFVTTASIDTEQFRQLAVPALQQAGVNPDQVLIFDDRTGQYGLESGNTSYSAGKAKAKDGSQLKQLMGDRDTVAYLDFQQDGSVKAHTTKGAKTALGAIQLAAQQQAPQPPAEGDLPF